MLGFGLSSRVNFAIEDKGLKEFWMRVVYHRRCQNLEFRLYHITYYYIVISNLDKECNIISYMMVTQVTKYDRDIILIIEWLYIS